MMKTRCIFAAAALIVSLTRTIPAAPAPGQAAKKSEFRPPAVPLVTHNPYLSIWSEADRLTDDVSRHWTHHAHPLVSLIRIDGKTLRLMGNDPRELPAFPQTGVQVLPTRSIYDFDDGHVHVTLTFMTAALPDDLEALAQPLSYITWQVRSTDGAGHAVSIYDSTSSLLSVNAPEQKVQWAREAGGGLTALRTGTVDQPLFTPAGDYTRIDWGFVYAAASTDVSKSAIGASQDTIRQFTDHGDLPAQDDAHMPRAAKEDEPVLAFAFDLGKVSAEPVSRHLIVAYDEIYSIKYFGQKLRPYWRRNGATPADMLAAAEKNYPNLVERCEAFDKDLIADLTKAGGARYAQIAALSYRQCLAGCGLAADSKGQPLLFTKENTSNGDIATVDVIFPMDPIWVVLSPTLAKASLVPILSYAASDHWKFPNAPHDLGTYPVARGTDDGGEGMPVEESGNMLILCDAIAQAEGNPDFVAPWWPQLTQWAKYLERYGLDPEEQLCTDDFMGHLAHNSNLSIKAIIGLAAYGDLCHRRGDETNAKKYFDLAKKDAEHWVKVADDEGHSRLAFDKPKTWSQKYNLVWDRILGLNIFPPGIAKQEVAYYKKVMLPFGVPLDSRTHLTKTDWSLWSATLADNPADFEAIVSPIYDYLNTTSARSPLVDSYVTDDIKSDGMHARPVVGGIFIKMLADQQLWKKWAARDKAKVGGWAPLPVSPKIVDVVPSSQHHPAIWRYTTQKPQDKWQEPGFDASTWQEGNGGFGTPGTPGAVVGTVWKTDDIWLRREFTMPEGNWSDLQLIVYHDEDVEIYINGVFAAGEGGYANAYEPMDIRQPARAILKPGAKITLAVHCHQTTGGQGVDVGLVDVVSRQP
ncbi:MAG: Glutaminase [Phycisphaerales bacterium]|nr:Glutaminase [Phycisphaerales bacterium]